MDPLDELRARRLIAQGLAPSAAAPRLDSATAVTTHLLALQGQNYRAGIRAIALRCSLDDAAVLAAVDKHRVVRGWPQRGTLHFMPAEDVRWMMGLCSVRIARGLARWSEQMGLSPTAVDEARAAFHAELKQRGPHDPLPRLEAYGVLAAAGVDPGDGRGPHLMRAFGGEGDVVQGPRMGAQDTFMHVDQLPVAQREVEDPLEEMGTRYARSHGPVSAKDLVWWSGLTVRQSRAALAAARGVMAWGEDYVMADWQADVTTAELAEALDREYTLPAFDEILLGYGDKSLILADEHRPNVLTKNGLSWPFTVANGVVTGRAAQA
ncbi:hypothetical protein CATRI_12925 [Corynebacterium atrinae]|uniref:winged helix DNA-binding domain-containing protein n=1 Tax=Corynebacterium atrinae TaxID=1336740 RepID=UPI0025B40628|nr:winged helix DNA-binding domain-containing protein [Corynebacterium atrinae]WJY64630.1 hypothetical protein CATRI_12925 [Corynebacterium atrinae]